MSKHEDSRNENSSSSRPSAGKRDMWSGLFCRTKSTPSFQHELSVMDTRIQGSSNITEVKLLTCFPITPMQATEGMRPVAAILDSRRKGLESSQEAVSSRLLA